MPTRRTGRARCPACWAIWTVSGPLNGTISRTRPGTSGGGLDVRFDLAIAFARAGDPQRALDHLEAIAAVTGPASYLRASIHSALDSLHDQPRWLALKGRYERWAEGR